MRKKAQENNFTLKFVRYESMSMPVVYTPPVIPIDFRIGHRFPKSAMPPPPPPQSTTTESATETSTNEPPPPQQQQQKSIQHDANTRGILLGDFSFLSRPPPTMSVPPPPVPPAPSKEDVIPVKTTPVPPPATTTSATTPATALEWDVEKERSSHTTSVPTNNARTQFLDAVKNRFTSASDSEQMTERQSMEAALEVRNFHVFRLLFLFMYLS